MSFESIGSGLPGGSLSDKALDATKKLITGDTKEDKDRRDRRKRRDASMMTQGFSQPVQVNPNLGA